MTTINMNSRKRTRSDDTNGCGSGSSSSSSPSFSLQRKIFVNQQIIDSQNDAKMKEIHGKTVNLLFQGLKNLYSNNSDNNNSSNSSSGIIISSNKNSQNHQNNCGDTTNNVNLLKLNKLDSMKNIKLNGNGQIQYVNGIKPLEHLINTTIQNNSNNLNKSKCCNRIAIINSECTNCNLQICEYCGYSCIDCGIHLCGACVTIFGCGTIDEPSCSNCQMFSS